MADSVFSSAPVRVEASSVNYTDTAIEAEYVYASSRVVVDDANPAGASPGLVRVVPTSTKMTIRTERVVPKVRAFTQNASKVIGALCNLARCCHRCECLSLLQLPHA